MNGRENVAGGFLDKLLGRPAPHPEVAAALAELERLRQERPSLAAPAALLAELLPILYELQPTVAPALPPERAADRLAAGVPLLRGEDLALDAGALRRRWVGVCAAVARHQAGGAATALAGAVKRGQLPVEGLAAAVLAGRIHEVHGRADALGLDAGLAATVLRFTLFPCLVSHNTVLAPLRAGAVWGRGYCPTCGSWPLLGEFRGLEQDRWLRCGLCAADWEFPRLACPFCDNRDHRRLAYLHVEGEESRRAATCEECRGYVKMIATLGPLSPTQLLVADLSTVYLDLALAERGQAVPT
jgi:FdhE protein